MPRGVPGSGKNKVASAEGSKRRRGRPGPRRPIDERLAEARQKLKTYEEESTKRLQLLRRKVATLEAQQATQPSKAQLRELVEGKTQDQIHMELLEAKKRLKLLEAATKSLVR